MSTPFIDETMLLAVHSGATWLDSNHPDWVTKIDLSKLNMNDCHNCVIGQAVGDYYKTLRAATIDVEDDEKSYNAEYKWSLKNGFCGPFINEADEHAYYKGLEVLWTVEVKKRLG
jgi:hypothetical protein